MVRLLTFITIIFCAHMSVYLQLYYQHLSFVGKTHAVSSHRFMDIYVILFIPLFFSFLFLLKDVLAAYDQVVTD